MTPPPTVPQVPPLGHDPGGQMKIPSDRLYIFRVWEDTQSLVSNIWNLLCNWNLMIFDHLTPPQGPRGGAKKCAVARPIHVSNSHTKVGWISSNGWGGDIAWRTDGRTEAIAISPTLFFKKRGHNFWRGCCLKLLRIKTQIKTVYITENLKTKELNDETSLFAQVQ